VPHLRQQGISPLAGAILVANYGLLYILNIILGINIIFVQAGDRASSICCKLSDPEEYCVQRRKTYKTKDGCGNDRED